MTIREIALILEEHAEADRIDHNDRVWLAWHVAALSRMKKLPKMKELIIPPKRRGQKRRQTAEEQMAIARQWAAVGR